MPESWYQIATILDNDDDTPEIKKKKALYRRIVANKKPYFMNYVYPEQRSTYNKYVKASNTKCLILHGMTIDELLAKPNKSTEEEEFLFWYNEQMPVGMNPCVMNKIAWKIEEAFKGYTAEIKHASDFDYTILKTDAEYTHNDFLTIKRLYKQYCLETQNYCTKAAKFRIDSDESTLQKDLLRQKFKLECFKAVSNENQLCNILLDLCYQRSNSKQFAWDMVGSVIIRNLLEKNKYKVKYLERDDNGDVVYCGEKFSVREGEIG